MSQQPPPPSSDGAASGSNSQATTPFAVWTSSWATLIRVVLVVLFAIGWAVVSIPRRRSRVNPR